MLAAGSQRTHTPAAASSPTTGPSVRVSLLPSGRGECERTCRARRGSLLCSPVGLVISATASPRVPAPH